MALTRFGWDGAYARRAGSFAGKTSATVIVYPISASVQIDVGEVSTDIDVGSVTTSTRAAG